MYGKLKDKYIDPFTDFGFKKLFGEEYQAYIDSLNSYRDLKNSLDYAEAKGKAEGLAEGEQERLKLLQEIEELKKQLGK